MTEQINLYEAKTRLSSLVERAAKGETIIIAKSGTPIAKLVPLSEGEPKGGMVYGLMDGEIRAVEDWDAPTPQWLIDAFEGKYDGDPEGLEEAARNDPGWPKPTE